MTEFGRARDLIGQNAVSDSNASEALSVAAHEPFPQRSSRAHADDASDLSIVGDAPSLFQRAFMSSDDVSSGKEILANVAYSKSAKGDRKQEKDAAESKNVKELLERIEDTASAHWGDKLWDGKYRSVTEDGTLGCAVSVSKVLIESGAVPKLKIKESVGDLDSALRAKGWSEVGKTEEIKPGYVMIGFNSASNWRAGGGNAHVGIVSDSGWVWNNSSRIGLGYFEPRWIAEPKDVALRPWKYNKTYALKPPGA